jgi:cytochrome P450
MTEDFRYQSLGAAPARIKGHWLAGSLLAFVHRPLEFYTECARLYGDIAIGRLGTVPICVVSHPRNVAHVLVEDAASYEQTRLLRVLLKPLLGEGLLIAGKESHARQRPLVERAVDAGIMVAWAEAVVHAAEGFAASWTNGKPLALYPAMLRIVSRILTGIAFGSGSRAIETAGAVERAVDVVTNRIRQFPPVPEIVPTRGNLEVRNALQELEHSLFVAIREKRAIPGLKSRLLSALVTARGEGLSLLTVKLVLAVLTRKFRLSLLPGQEVSPVAAFALRPADRLLVEARPLAGHCNQE